MSLFKLYNVRTRTTNPLHCLYLRIRVNVHTYVCMFPICGYTAGHGSVTPSLGAAPWTASSVCRCGSLGFGVLCWDCSSAGSLRGAAAWGLDCDSKLALAKTQRIGENTLPQGVADARKIHKLHLEIAERAVLHQTTVETRATKHPQWSRRS